ncbi:MAG: hypothetical protein IJB68_09035 [Ruminococcus sp.]|nr:hypothetical protein [Ruminococcus sp.]
MGKELLEVNVLKTGDKEAWKAEYNGHTIMVINGLKTVLEIDGVEQDKAGSLTKVILMGKLPEGESVIVTLESKFKEMEAHLIIGTEVEMQNGVFKKDKSFMNFDEEGATAANIKIVP